MLLKIVVVIAGYHAFVGLMYLLLGTRPASILLFPHRFVRDVFQAKLFSSSKPTLRKQKKEEEKKAKRLAIERCEAEVKAATEKLDAFRKEHAAFIEEQEQLREKRAEADNSLWDAKHQYTTADKGFQGICGA